MNWRNPQVHDHLIGDLPTIRINAPPPTLCDLLAYLPVMQKQNSNKRMMMTITENGIPCRMAMCYRYCNVNCRRSVFPPLRKVKVFSSSSPRRNEEEEEVAKRKSCWTFSWLSLFMFIFLLPPFSASQTCWSINR